MNQNQSNKKLFPFIFIFIGIMFVSPLSIITRFDSIPFFVIIPVIMFGIFGLFSFLVVKNGVKNVQNSNNNQNDYKSSDERHCTSCHESIPVNSEYCPYCGLEQTDFVECDYCGSKNSKNDLMCTNCNGLLK